MNDLIWEFPIIIIEIEDWEIGETSNLYVHCSLIKPEIVSSAPVQGDWMNEWFNMRISNHNYRDRVYRGRGKYRKNIETSLIARSR